MKVRYVALAIVALLFEVCVAEELKDEAAPPALKPVKAPVSRLDEETVAALTQRIEASNDANQAGSLYEDRANEYGRAGKWFEAAADFRKAAQADPFHSHYWMRGGVALLLAENPMAYQDLIDNMLKQFADAESASPYDRERVAKMCVLSKRKIGKQEEVERMIDKAVSDTEGSSWAEYFPSTQAIVRYRYGKYKAALESIAESDRINDRAGSDDVTAINRAVEALCRAKLGETEQARAALLEANQRLREALAERDLVRDSGYWHDWMIAKLLHDEADALLKELKGTEAARATQDRGEESIGWMTYALMRSGDGAVSNGTIMVAQDKRRPVEGKRPIVWFGLKKLAGRKTQFVYLLLFRPSFEVGKEGSFQFKPGKVFVGSKGSDRIRGPMTLVVNDVTFTVEYEFDGDLKAGKVSTERLKIGERELGPDDARIFLVRVEDGKVVYQPVDIPLPSEAPDATQDDSKWRDVMLKTIVGLKEQSPVVKAFFDGA